MYTSLYEVFSIGIGPSSSHTMGPMRAAARFVQNLQQQGLAKRVQRVVVRLYGSLALTGEGHGTPAAIAYGLMGLDAETLRASDLHIGTVLPLGGSLPIAFSLADHIVLDRETTLPEHPNGMRFSAMDATGASLLDEVYFSIGGGAIRRQDEIGRPPAEPPHVPYEFGSCRELMRLCEREGLSIAELTRLNEYSLRSPEEVTKRVRLICNTMQEAVDRGISTNGLLPGELRMNRRAPLIYARLEERFRRNETDALTIIDWINLWAFAVAEENAGGGRVVTAPTMGSAGILPAVLRYYCRYGCKESPYSVEQGMEIMLLTASAICSLYRANASISGAEVGCQGEVGVACSMAAAGLTAAMGGTNAQVENAAEIAMEHNLGLTCDPVCGLVQVPCIERNAIGAVKAVNAARLAMRGDGSHYVSLDSVIATMDETGRHLSPAYRETSLAGLAKNALTC
ncbi:MAG: L-serine ammonia-lyase [Akkermansiaceae bacterium]|nr:L-serine ammonia-lyase [Akkermansiaceae bacterium]